MEGYKTDIRDIRDCDIAHIFSGPMSYMSVLSCGTHHMRHAVFGLDFWQGM
jgi:hypothetical protein